MKIHKALSESNLIINQANTKQISYGSLNFLANTEIKRISEMAVYHITCRCTNISYFKIICWAAIFAPHCNSITCQLLALESCSNLQKTRRVFQFAMKNF